MHELVNMSVICSLVTEEERDDPVQRSRKSNKHEVDIESDHVFDPVVLYCLLKLLVLSIGNA